MKTLRFQNALLPDGIRPVQLQVDDTGLITAVEDAADGPWDGWLALPGMVNAHSHCFQRVMTGFVEAAGGDRSFWGWRELMYRIAQNTTPRDQYVIARRAFREMLAAGYTTAAEFHYLHHNVDGSAGTEMAQAVIDAAADTGIRLRLLPVLYQRGGFGHPATDMQRRFVHKTVDDYLQLVARLGDAVAGIAPHSVRAVDPAVLPEVVAGAREIVGDDMVIHMHVAEQMAEVEATGQATGFTPVALIAEHCALNPLWSFVHATHVNEHDMRLMLDNGVNVVLCPLTEANLGDGVFPVKEFIHAGGRIAIGSDCNARIDVVEELRLMEYAQRLVRQRRAVLADQDGLGARLWAHTARAGAGVLALNAGRIEVGCSADLAVLSERPPLSGLAPMRAMDALVTGGDAANIAEVYVGGRLCAPDAEPDAQFVAVMQRLCA
ncbi:MAG: formimidoylglutamate deiminase [Gammaproteobacteria bacterium]|nr:formimidoylglutamate deiminase [Gammaproteobacteria bacterium]NNF59949.1 formimidoylglutamate deiminase [Gammaproteobacteria bacterium]NNM19687.1 formimidoylglutamate deiminase [Gammaproteobacteria bacterium]